MSYDKDIARYFKEASRTPLLSKEEELILSKLAKNDITARNKLISANLRFVIQIANKYKGYVKPHKYSLLDLIQEGNFGLLHAVEQYKPDSGFRFTTYAVYWIKARIMSFIIRMHSPVRIGTIPLERKAFFKMGKMREILEEKNVERKNDLETILAAELKITVLKLKELEKRFSWNDVSLDKKMSSFEDDSDSTTLKDMLLAPSVEEEIEKKNFQHKLREVLDFALDNLTEQEREVIEARWLTEDGSTLQAIADKHNFSREWIRQIELQAFEKIRQLLAKDEDGNEILKEIL